MKFIKLGMTVASVAAMTFLSGCAASDVQTMVSGGEAISTSSVKLAPVSQDHVKLYYSNAPKHYQVIGRVSANNDNAVGIPHSEKSIEEELIKQAASLGGTGVINISSSPDRTTGDVIR